MGDGISIVFRAQLYYEILQITIIAEFDRNHC